MKDARTAQTNDASVDRLGVWIIGGRGAVASSTVVGACALRRGATKATGVVTKTAPFASLPLAAIETMAFGGHDPAQNSLLEGVRSLGREAMDQHLLESFAGELAGAERAMVAPPVRDVTRPLSAFVAQVQQDVREFMRRHELTRTVVVNLASTEPPVKAHPAHESIDAFRRQLAAEGPLDEREMPTSALYAYAALDAGLPYINFTPSTGANLPALDQLARERRLPYAGRDGKTGETLLKTVLAPMFFQRALRVQSWIGYNMLGNGDGRSLADPVACSSKLTSKGAALPQILGYEPFSHVAIDYVPSLGDWKTAVDFIYFEGFLDTPMNMQFIWRGCDSMLAAPLVLDLARLTDLAHRRGDVGALGHLGFFFKDPTGGTTHDLSEQYKTLLEHVHGQRERFEPVYQAASE
jgi:myo-inositol-1-phosphate synthase